MNPDVKKQWVAALRSGKYAQGLGALRTGDNFCCLGVLCDLAVKQGIIPEPEHGIGSTYDGKADALPVSVQKWAGLDGGDPLVETTVEMGVALDRPSLAELNDEYKFDFNQIADIIEEGKL